MGFTKTSEGRVFFQSADNDDLPKTQTTKKKVTPKKAASEPVLQGDSVQVQILVLLKTLNAKLQATKEDQEAFKKELLKYRATVKSLEEKTASYEENYIDLEQKVAVKQKESSKKTDRVDESVKSVLKQLEEAKELLSELEEKHGESDETLESLKRTIAAQKDHDQKLLENQKKLEKAQKEQGEKMVDNVAAYVALTKRVSENETRHDTLDNKIEDMTNNYMKLDRKIDKAIEDRNRILRKVDRIEQAVLETRDAINAKAMVLLTDKGVSGIDMPEITDRTFKTDPNLLNKRLQEEALMPWWRRPVRVQSTSLALIIMVVMLLGWVLNEVRHADTSQISATDAFTPTVSLNARPLSTTALERDTRLQEPSNTSFYNIGEEPLEEVGDYEDLDPKPFFEEKSPFPEDIETTSQADTIKIHRGVTDPGKIRSPEPPLDVTNDQELAAAFDEDPEQVAKALNQIEPAHLKTQDKEPPKQVAPPKTVEQQPLVPATPKKSTEEQASYIAALRSKIKPDPNLTDVAKRIETQAFEGVPEAQHDMGAIYVAGHGSIRQDLKRAVQWFEEAAKNNVPNAKYNLGVLYHQGLGIDQDVNKAMKLYQEAADLNHPEAQYNLGIASIEGIGVPYNPKKAAEYFESAARRGVTEAAYNLGLIYENGLLGETKPDQALAWYKTAADQGSPEAQSALDQLAASLGIGISDVNRIVEKLQNSQAKENTANLSSQELTAEIQRALVRRGLYPGPVDGVNGPNTANAIRDFQRSANMTVTGQPSSELLATLQSDI
ncbi:MAG: hypothetical protein GC137_01595 [Alphaproteobacteria bacterium]|nr:hypothetical protein [Alphaproteobacteria bacterium]